jgi:hypothetical protein
MAAFKFRHRRVRRGWLLSGTLVLTAAVFLLVIGSASGVLPGSPSKFESGNDPTTGLGNMIVDNLPVPPATPHTDWISVAGGGLPYVHLTDTAASNSDDSFTPGQKQDTTCPTIEGHKNPPKDDFTDVASYTEVAANGDTYLYGATIRYAANGNASENIELKQGSGEPPAVCSGTADLLERAAGDKLIAIDYLGGGKAVQFHVLTWVTSGACFVGNDTAPCWGVDVQELNPSQAEGGVNTSAISIAQNPISSKALVAGQFAEFGINLAAAGIIPAGSCKSFSQTVWESRSSGSSFVSSTKDIVIETHPISNCGEIVIIKHSNPRGVDQDFSYTSDIAGSELTCVADSTPASFTLNDKAGVDSSPPVVGGNVEDCTKVPAGTYHVTEGSDPSGFSFASLSCSAGGTQDTTDPRKANITLAAGATVTCTYTNNQLFGAIKILKNSTKGGAVTNAGAVFSYNNGAGSSGSVIDNGTGDENTAIGEVCVSGLAAGTTYTVLETSPPAGYGGGTTLDRSADAVAGTDCTTTLPGTGGTVTYTEPPLSDIQVRFRDGGSGETSATISCDNATGTTDNSDTTGWDKSKLVTGIEVDPSPITVTCTIVIDP